jgi:hypothetical protein
VPQSQRKGFEEEEKEIVGRGKKYPCLRRETGIPLRENGKSLRTRTLLGEHYRIR